MLTKISATLKGFFDIPAVLYIWVILLSMGLLNALQSHQYYWAAFTALCLFMEYIDFIITNKGRAV